jgi:hypothetical protein
MTNYSEVTGKEIKYLVTARDNNGYQFREVVQADNCDNAKQIVLEMPETMYIINVEYL